MAKRWVATIFDTEWEPAPEKIEDLVKGIMGRETCPTTGKEHWQCFFYFKVRKRLSTVQKWIEGKWHCEVARKTDKENYDYCSKDGEFKLYGDWTQVGQGRRTDIEFAVEAIMEGASTLDLIQHYPNCFIKYHRGLEKAKKAILSTSGEVTQFRNIETHVLWGPAGSGKTRAVYEQENPTDIYKADMVYDGWWDGYEGEKVLLIDDFYGGIRYTKLLNILDGYKLQIPVKGGSTWAQWTKVYITSNVHPRDWYEKGMTDALKRRLTKVCCVGVQEVAGNTSAATSSEESDGFEVLYKDVYQID